MSTPVLAVYGDIGTSGGDLGRPGVFISGGGKEEGGGEADFEGGTSVDSLAGLAGTAIGLTGLEGVCSSLLMMESMLKLLDLAAGLGGDGAAEGCREWRWLNGDADAALDGDWLFNLNDAKWWCGELAPPPPPPPSLLPPLPLESVLNLCFLEAGDPFSRPCSSSLFLGDVKLDSAPPPNVTGECPNDLVAPTSSLTLW